MSAAVDFAHHNFGRHTQLDGMAHRRHDYDDPYAPKHGHYAQEEQFQQPVHTRQLPSLPPMATMIPGLASSHSPVRSNSRETLCHSGRPAPYSEYASPWPVGQTPPQFTISHNEPRQFSRRPADIRHSPTLSSTASDRSSEEMAQELRMRQMSANGQGQIPHSFVSQPSPRSRGNPYPQDIALVPVSAKAPSRGFYSSPSLVPNSHAGPPQLPRSPPTTQPSTSPRQEPKSMSISNLVTPENGSNTTTNNTSTKSPATTSNPPIPPTTAPRPPNSEYRITVRQQPFAARSCGFGERDRRVIDPPPIVQLTIHDPSLSADEHARRLRHQFSVVHCSIWDETGAKDMSSMPDDFRQQRRLMGTLVASPFVGLDEKGEEGCFFCFPDLSCRTPGTFRLKFALVVLDPARMCTGDRSAIVATAMSDAFQVYNAKDFPGMRASTPLTKRLKEQGCLISIKKGNEKREVGGGGKGDDDDEDEDGDDEDGGGSGSGNNGGGGGDSSEGKGRAKKRAKR
ncbi:velvet factor-domain-containing protein [Chaetomium strumarium]|uniref:Velvet factor-domain-containing protein n=1 Tax=Chaetomium strumarium TaxID=1170767 RepID=A0AAJ0GM03_9PEZI|nr:velvet factor-domain-containing protein [Chaetomium strumarium]